jgi:hypothetical protein
MVRRGILKALQEPNYTQDSITKKVIFPMLI